jgi:hypothetical protein
MYNQDHCIPYLYSTAITWLQVWARASIQLLHVGIALNKRYEIVVSWSSCIEALAQTCNHVIAVLYKYGIQMHNK